MPHKVLLLAVLVTLVYWTGQAGGCASSGASENYKILDEDRPMFDTSVDPHQPGARMEDETSLTGVDRSHWPIVTVGPGRPRVDQPPRYFQDWDLSRFAAADSRGDGETEPGRGVPENWTRSNALGVVAQPVKFLIDFAMLPVRAVTGEPTYEVVLAPASTFEPVTALLAPVEDHVAEVAPLEPHEATPDAASPSDVVQPAIPSVLP